MIKKACAKTPLQTISELPLRSSLRGMGRIEDFYSKTQIIVFASCSAQQDSQENRLGGLATQALLGGNLRQPFIEMVRDLKIPGQNATLTLIPPNPFWKGTLDDIATGVDVVLILAHPTSDLPAVRTDARNVKGFFEDMGKEVIDLCDEYYTKDALLRKIKSLVKAHPNVIIYSAGHGTDEYTQNPCEATGLDTSLQFGAFRIVDDDYAGMVVDDEIRRQIVFIFDTCHAGGFVDDLQQAARTIPPARVAAIPPARVAAIPPAQVAAIPPAPVAAIPPAPVVVIPPAQVAAIPPAPVAQADTEPRKVEDPKPAEPTQVDRILARGVQYIHSPPAVSVLDTVWMSLLDGDLSVTIPLVVCLVCLLARAIPHRARGAAGLWAWGLPLVLQVVGMFGLPSLAGDVRVLSVLAGVAALIVSVVVGGYYSSQRRGVSTELVVRLARLCKISTDLGLIWASLLLYSADDKSFMSVAVKGQRTLMFFPTTAVTYTNATCNRTARICEFEVEGSGKWRASRKESFTKVGKDWIATCDRTMFSKALKTLVGNDMSMIEIFQVGNFSADVGKIQAEASSLMFPSTLNLQAPVDAKVMALLKQLENNNLGAILRPAKVSYGYVWECLYLLYHGVGGAVGLLAGLLFGA